MKELDNAADSERLVEVLTDLDAKFSPTEQLLRETRIGVAVNKLRSHSDPRVAALVKKMVASWREKVQMQKQKKQRELDASPKPKPGAAANASTKSKTNATGGKIDANEKRDWKSDGVDTNIYSDPVRNSCVQVTYNALVVQSTHPPSEVLKAAKDVEQAVFAAERSTSSAYRNKMRSLFVNLKDPKNPTLREHVVTGRISGERLRTLKPQEMANDELKKQVEEIEKQNLFNAQSAQEQRSVTDRFTCGKCKEKKVSYYQMQTRSADEPLTTFCTCENCGNRWKFS